MVSSAAKTHQITGRWWVFAALDTTLLAFHRFLAIQLRNSRLLLSDLTARTIRKGLELLGIGVEEKM